ncbi:MAG: UDP-N-acetylglucosamine 2-epimerase (non-hydrolyzing) [Tissierellia bacterium]|nr:UDP-N-acetylglucosamine 2-epimerase (non-hydrolyzing) [Tissierellia bacterium]
MNRLKVLTVVGTRPEIIRLSSVIKRLDKSEAIEHILVHTGQNYDYELNEIFFEDFGLRKPDYFLNAAEGGPMATIGNILKAIDPILEKENPEAFLVLGDTNSCLAAIAAKRRKIPIFHMEAGNRCFDQRVPEETNRKIVDHIADINMPYSSIAREYLLAEGIPADRIIKTGSPMFEVLREKKEDIENSDVLDRLGLTEDQYFLVSAHREENIESDRNFLRLIDILNAIANLYDIPVIVSTHPRTRNRIDQMGVEIDERVQLMKPLGFSDYNKLQLYAKTVLSDSGTISEETSILGLKSLNIREAHERPEAMEEAVVTMTGLNKDRILQGIAVVEMNGKRVQPVLDYTIDLVSEKVEKIILSYTDYVKRKVWGINE